MTPDILARCRAAACSVWPVRSLPSIRNRQPAVLLIVLAISIGAVGWSGHVLALPLAMLFPTLWAFAPSRRVAVFVAAAYFLAASRGLPQGVADFYSADLWPGLLLWLAAATSFVVVHAVLWRKEPGKGMAVRTLAAAVLMGLPPFGITGWAPPLAAAGVLFPGWGWLGVAATAAGLVTMSSRYWPAAAMILGGCWLWSAVTWTDPVLPEGWKGIDLHHGQTLGRDRSLDHHRSLLATVRAATVDRTRFIVLPESALGFWTPTLARLWQDGLRDLDVTVLAGAVAIDADGYDNITVAISSNDTRILYRERMPVPVSMWQPWLRWAGLRGGARAYFFDNPVVEIEGMRIAPLICYEQLILWPVLQSMLHAPDIIVATANGWWAAGTPIVAVQKASVAAWAKLFDIPRIMSFNT